MALVNVTNIVVLDNPAPFTNPFTFEITFECLQELEDDLEWKVLYVSSAEDAAQDQVLEEVMVGPVPVGVNKFVLQAETPDVSKIPEEDIIGVTVILITCSYRDQEFVRVGYYVNNEYTEEVDPENPPRPVDLTKLTRSILADKPRVTRFPVDWGLGMSSLEPPPQEVGDQEQLEEEEGQMVGDDGDEEEDDDDEEEEQEEDGEVELNGVPEGQADGMDLVSPVKGGSEDMFSSPMAGNGT